MPDITKVFLNKFRKSIKIILTKGPKELVKKITGKIKAQKYINDLNQGYYLWLKNNYPSAIDLKKSKKEIEKLKYKPKISILTPVYNPDEDFLCECIESVINQTYENWELCLADDASSNPKIKEIIKRYAQKDKRIKYKFRKKNGHICRASNDALKLASGEFVGFLDHDDILWPNALYEVVKLLNEKPHARFIYSDEDKLDFDGKTHIEPFFKPDWSPNYLRSINYITHFTVIKKELIEKLGGFRVGTEGAQDWDLFLRATWWLEKNVGHCHPLDPKCPIQHIPTILYSWRKSPTSTASDKHAEFAKTYAYKNQKKVLEEDIKRRGYKGWVEPTKYLGLWRVRYKIKGNPLVSIVIPTKNKYEYIFRCLSSILQKTTYKNFELVIVDTGSSDENVWRLYDKIKKKHLSTQVLKWNKEFNFSAVCNYGAEKSKGEYLLFLNNDTEVITPDWIEGMLEYAQRKEIGAVGCQLLYPDDRIQHTGLIIGVEESEILGEKGFVSNYFRLINPEYNYSILSLYFEAIRDISAVTAACLLIKKEKFYKVKGFDEKFRIAFNDVDLNLKLLNKKFFNLINPFVKLYHHESISVGDPTSSKRDLTEFKNEIILMKKKWEMLLEQDKFFNPNLRLKNAIPTVSSHLSSDK